MKSPHLLLLISAIFILGCSDNSISKVHNKKILDSKIKCMKLVVFPPNKIIENKLHELYTFDNNCNLKLFISYKGSIVCNSNQNSEKKVLGMPKSYLRFELKKQNTLFYSYYIDLNDNFNANDVENGFDRMKETLEF